MTLLAFRRTATAAPETRPRVWYQALFKYYEPLDGRMTQEEAAQVIARHWARSWKDIKQNGVT